MFRAEAEARARRVSSRSWSRSSCLHLEAAGSVGSAPRSAPSMAATATSLLLLVLLHLCWFTPSGGLPVAERLTGRPAAQSAARNHSKVLIIGAGAAGHAAAARLMENNFFDVTILEAEGRVGGRIRTVNFAENVVDLGAEWVHGEAGNVLYEMAEPLELLAHKQSRPDTSMQFVWSGGAVADAEHTAFLYRLADKVSDELMADGPDSPGIIGSYGEQFLDSFGQRLLESEQRPPAELVDRFLDWYEKASAFSEGVSWFNVSTRDAYETLGGEAALPWKRNGMRTALDLLTRRYPDPAQELPVRRRVLLNSEVRAIRWGERAYGAAGPPPEEPEPEPTAAPAAPAAPATPAAPAAPATPAAPAAPAAPATPAAAAAPADRTTTEGADARAIMTTTTDRSAVLPEATEAGAAAQSEGATTQGDVNQVTDITTEHSAVMTEGVTTEHNDVTYFTVDENEVVTESGIEDTATDRATREPWTAATHRTLGETGGGSTEEAVAHTEGPTTDHGVSQPEDVTTEHGVEEVDAVVTDERGLVGAEDATTEPGAEESTTEHGVVEADDVTTPDGSPQTDAEAPQADEPQADAPQEPRPPIVVELSNGARHTADMVLVTVSLGVLKHSADTLFDPPLPRRKMKAVRNLGFGQVNKLFMYFAEPWWPSSLSGFSLLVTKEDLDDFKRKYPQYGARGHWVHGLSGFYIDQHKPNVVLMDWMVGEPARVMERYSDYQIMMGCKHWLDMFLGRNYSIPWPVGFTRSKWWSNPHFRGSYSYRSLDSDRADAWPRHLEEPLYDDQGIPALMFAGEATSEFHHSTVHGAIETGWREAERILRVLRAEGRLGPPRNLRVDLKL